MANVKMNSKPTAEDFAYAYVEDVNGALVRVPKDKVVMLGKDGGYYAPYVDSEGNLSWTPSKDGMTPIDGTNIKGDKGDKGDSGKSAYEYAKDGGYTGTESDFANKLATDTVSVTYDASTKTLSISSASGG